MDWPNSDAPNKEEWFRYRLPGLTDEQYAALAGSKEPALTPKKQIKALKLWGAGMNRVDLCRALKVQRQTIEVTGIVFPEFQAAWDEIKACRTKQVESVFYRYCFGQLRTVKVTYVGMLDENAEPILDSKGNPKLRLAKKEVQTLQPTAGLLQFYLQARMPKKYGGKQPEEPEQIEAQTYAEEEVRQQLLRLAR